MSTSVVRNVNNPILKPLKNHSWESSAVMNASVILEKGVYHMLYRALGDKSKKFPSGKIHHLSYIGYAKSRDGINFVRREKPFIQPEKDWEMLGCEDPSITKIGNEYYIFYTAISAGNKTDLNVLIAGARTKDFKKIEKLGVINLKGRSKAAALFPEKINGKYSFAFTQNADRPNSTIYYVQINKIKEIFDDDKWKKIKKVPLITPSKNAYRGPELGAVPLKISKGWLLIYCPESLRKEWFIGAALLDIKNPTKVLGRTKRALIKPKMDYELKGYTRNVVFPSGATINGDKLSIYYGGADTGVCLATLNIHKLLKLLTN